MLIKKTIYLTIAGQTNYNRVFTNFKSIVQFCRFCSHDDYVSPNGDKRQLFAQTNISTILTVYGHCRYKELKYIPTFW